MTEGPNCLSLSRPETAKRLVAHHFGGEPGRRAAGRAAGCGDRRSRNSERSAWLGLSVGGGEHQLAEKGFDAPAVIDPAGAAPGSRAVRDDSAACRWSRSLPGFRPGRGRTARPTGGWPRTLAVSGFSGDTSQRAMSRRFGARSIRRMRSAGMISGMAAFCQVAAIEPVSAQEDAGRTASGPGDARG